MAGSDRHRKSRYKLSEAEYEKMVEDRSGRCDICGLVPSRPLCVDHDHNCCPGTPICGKCVRGLLCHSCNRGLGQFRDDPAVVASAAAYLADWV